MKLGFLKQEGSGMPVPFNGKEFTFAQPDGTKIKVRGWGNQHHAVFETLDGFTVTKDPQTGFYQYAKVSSDKSSLEPSGVKAGLDPDALHLAKHLRVSKNAARELSLTPYVRMGSKTRWEERLEKRRSEQQRALMAPGMLSAPPREERKGEYVGLCILIQFPDVPGNIDKSEVEEFCNKTNYSKFGNKGSVHDYFFDVSGGRLKYTNIVTSYYTAKNPKAYYTDPNLKAGPRARQLIVEALSDLKAKGFDFSRLSVDDQGYVYALNAFYAGPCENDWNIGLWPHSWTLASPFDAGNGRKFRDYQITDMGSELSIATFCHENCHMVCDFPDLYDYGDQSNGVGLYCIMCAGGIDEKNPTQVCAYLKYKAGWADKVTALTEGEYTAKAGMNDFFIYARNPAEYFIIENRVKEKRDSSLPNSGLTIWHVDEQGSNEYEDMLPAKHYECSLEQADNRFDLEHRSNNGDTGDLFGAPDYPKFGDSTSPGSKWWDGISSGLEITGIGEAGKEISFSFSGETGNIFKKTSSPGRAIPDNNRRGIRDVITFDDDAIISSLKVDVDITHTFQGDLKLTLISPAGTLAVLHDRNGGNANDIKRTFDISSTPSLSSLLNQSLKGKWTLRVQDLARSDKGKLNSWGLEITGIEGQAGNVIEKDEEPDLKITDDDPAGIMSTITLDSPGMVKNVEVSVDITHAYIGDLTVTLVSPRGTTIDLHNRFGGSQDNIIKNYTAATNPELEKLAGESIKGKWQLLVVDQAAQDEGKLNRWSLKIIPA